ncbi:uncharacterized protein LOC144357901 [Saccoglossus kowalevskii]
MENFCAVIDGIKSGKAVASTAGTLIGTKQEPNSACSVFIEINNNTSFVIKRCHLSNNRGFSALNGWTELKPYSCGTIRCQSHGFMIGCKTKMSFEATSVPCIKKDDLQKISEVDRHIAKFAMGTEHNIIYLPNTEEKPIKFSLQAHSPYFNVFDGPKFGACFGRIEELKWEKGPIERTVMWDNESKQKGFTIHYKGNNHYRATMTIDLEH